MIRKQLVSEVQLHLIPNDSLIGRARNKCAKFFLDGGFDKLLFVDADLAWKEEWIELLLRSKRPIIGGTYPLKSHPITLNFNPMLGEASDVFGRERGVEAYRSFVRQFVDSIGEVEVRHVPTGFLMIDRSVFLSLIEKKSIPPYESFQPDTGKIEVLWDFFPTRVIASRYESEDWAFCSIAREAGFPVYLQTKAVCAHLGNYLYRAEER